MRGQLNCDLCGNPGNELQLCSSTIAVLCDTHRLKFEEDWSNSDLVQEDIDIGTDSDKLRNIADHRILNESEWEQVKLLKKRDVEFRKNKTKFVINWLDGNAQ